MAEDLKRVRGCTRWRGEKRMVLKRKYSRKPISAFG